MQTTTHRPHITITLPLLHLALTIILSTFFSPSLQPCQYRPDLPINLFCIDCIATLLVKTIIGFEDIEERLLKGNKGFGYRVARDREPFWAVFYVVNRVKNSICAVGFLGVEGFMLGNLGECRDGLGSEVDARVRALYWVLGVGLGVAYSFQLVVSLLWVIERIPWAFQWIELKMEDASRVHNLSQRINFLGNDEARLRFCVTELETTLFLPVDTPSRQLARKFHRQTLIKCLTLLPEEEDHTRIYDYKECEHCKDTIHPTDLKTIGIGLTKLSLCHHHCANLCYPTLYSTSRIKAINLTIRSHPSLPSIRSTLYQAYLSTLNSPAPSLSPMETPSPENSNSGDDSVSQPSVEDDLYNLSEDIL